MAVVSAEAQRALELWVNRLRAELRETRAELHDARRVANELAVERDNALASRQQGRQQDVHARQLESQLEKSVAECRGLREELAEMARLCKTHERDVRDLRAEVRGEQAKAALLREERSGRGAKKDALSEQLQVVQAEAVELRQENRARNAEVRLLRSQRDRDAARRAQEQRARKELRLAIKEIAAVVDGVTAQMRNSENRHAALPLGAPNPTALERVLGRLRTALRVGPDASDNVDSESRVVQAGLSTNKQSAAATVCEEPPSAFGPSPAVTRGSESDSGASRRRRPSTNSTRPRTTAR
eukprot:COSAG02_NODE_5005_length_4726_cov_78.139615_7_plen_300_part_00